MGEEVIDLDVWDSAGVVTQLVHEPCEVLQHAANNQKDLEVVNVIDQELRSHTLDHEGPGRGETEFQEVVREVAGGDTQYHVEAGGRVLGGRVTGGLRACGRTCGTHIETRGARGSIKQNTTTALHGGRIRVRLG